MFNYITPYESTHALIVLALIAIIVGVAFYFGNKQYQEYALKKLAKEQAYNEKMAGIANQANREVKSIDLETIRAKTLMITAEGDAADKKFPKSETPKVVERDQ